MAPVVEAYQAMRGASFLVAVTFAAEIGDVRRFDTPRQLMSFLGLVPAESSTGDTIQRKGLTLAGNRRAGGESPQRTGKPDWLFRDLGLEMTRIGLEAGPLSQWLYAAMKNEGLAVELLETRHVHDAFKAMPVKSDRNDARGIAQLMRLGWFRPVHCKSMPAQEVRALLTARKLVQSKLFDIEMSLRGILRGFGLKIGRTTPNRFRLRVEELVAGHPTLEIIGKALLAAHEVLLREFNGFEKRVRQQARQDKRVRLVMSAPGVRPIVGLTYVAAVDDPARFKSSKQVGPHFS